MKKLVFKIIALVLPLMSIIGVFNYNIDSAQLYHNMLFDEIIKELNDDNTIKVPPNYDERNFLPYFYNEVAGTDIIVLGASRSREITSGMFKNETLFNFSVAAANLNDIIAFTGIIYKKNQLPEKIILEVTHPLFNGWFKKNSKRGFDEESYDYMMDLLECEMKNNEKSFISKFDNYSYIFSPSYFQQNYRYLKSDEYVSNKSIEIYKGNTNDKLEYNLLEPDGHMIIKGYANGAGNAYEQIQKQTIKYTRNSLKFCKDDVDAYISEDSIQLFELLVSKLQADGIEVIFFIAPFAPYTFEHYSIHLPFVNETEEYLIEYTSDNGIKLIGSYNPHKYELYDRWDFYNANHPSRRTVESIFNLEY